MEAQWLLPLVLVVDDEPLHREFATRVLTATDWQVVVAASGEEALDLLAPCPALVLMDLQMTRISGWDAVTAIRRSDGQAASVPVLAYTTLGASDVSDLRTAGFDGLVTKPCTAAELATAAAAWRPDGATAALDRLEASFGTAEIGAMTGRFRDMLTEALTRLDDDGAAPLAHRLAGLAGTLGFAAAGQAWLALSNGDKSAGTAARRETRRAIATIDRRANDAPPSTSV